ncbi:methyltransferase domain-containing protein [Rhizobium sp. X9]|uniref:class I SAM-dependent methyltransferase n=1 Tax=Rhizobium sp. X9 TaxID=2815360 RepID=UPI001C0AE5B0|nr:methyltransferase domain-containing protein [Rhizobium sp. X9]
MKLYVGSHEYKPEGYLTVDIDPGMKPDIVADITNMTAVADGSCSEIVAGHVLEHIDWPDSFLAFAEFARALEVGGTLKIAVPDMNALLRMMLSGDSAFHVVGLIYGVGGRVNKFEQHRYGYTIGMLIDILETLGFGEFDWWNSDFADASNGWAPRFEDKHVGISLNLKAVKKRAPVFDTKQIYGALVDNPLSDFLAVVGDLVKEHPPVQSTEAYKIYQRIHLHLIESEKRVRLLEERYVKQGRLKRFFRRIFRKR